ncbi:MAG TPA: indolepyruvate oxidoreductase subunit beta [Verrucomicrobia bacterium]|nr:MAG: indolepyruvate oxidoreductase [Lentisphaerae bacterium GWF2_57_35]HBA85878.1 indolepyruvate oxidoreductase subunit beta [Verrucomicrobiota bacterium]
MKQDIIIAGVGGQGLLTIAGVIGATALKAGLNVKQSEVHGMAQRGGAVVSHLRLSSQPIASDLAPEGSAHLLLSTEPMEALRYLPLLRQDAWLVSNKNPVQNISAYPSLEALWKRIGEWPHPMLLDADELARSADVRRASNVVMLGAASVFIPLSHERMKDEIRSIFDRKGSAIVEKNINAFDLGRAAALKIHGK